MSKKQIPVVENGKLESGIKVGSKNWEKELQNLDSFRYVPNSDNAPFTVRKEKGGGQADYWYGYRKVSNRLYKRYLGKASDLITERLEEIAEQLNIPPEPREKKEVTDNQSVTSDEVKRLQQRVEGLEAELKSKNEELAEASKKIESLTVELTTVRDGNDRLHRELHKKTDMPDYQQLHKSYLKSLRLGTQAPEYKKTDKHIKGFIDFIENHD